MKFWAFFRQKFWRVVKTAFYLSIGTVWGKTFSWRTYVLFVILGYWAKTCWPFLAKVSEGLSKLHSTCPYEKYEEKQFFEERMYILSFWDIEQKRLALFWKNIRRICQNCVLHLRNGLMQDNVLKNLGFFVFAHWAKTFLAFFRKNCGGYTETVFYLPIGSFRKNIFFKNLCFFNFFGPWTKTFQPIFRKLFGGVVKTAFYLSKGTVWKKIFLKDVCNFYHLRTLNKFFWPFFSKNLGGALKTAFYVSRGTVGGKLNFLKKVYFLFIFAHWDEDFSTFVGKFSAVPSKLHSTSP